MFDRHTGFGIGKRRDLNGAIARPAKAEIREIREGEGNRGKRRRGFTKSVAIFRNLE